MQLLGGAELYSQLDVTQLDNLRSKVLDKAKAFVEDFAKSLYIQCGSDGRFRKSYRFKQIWRQHFDSESDEPLEEEDQSEERETRRNRLIETAKKARELYSDEGDTIIVRQKDLPEDVHWEVAEPMQTDTISRKVPSSKTLSHEMPDPAASVEEVYNNCASPPKNLLIAKPPVKIISRPPIVDKSMPEVSNVLPGETSSQLSGTSCLKIPPSLSPNEPCDPNPSKIHSNAQSPTLGASGPAPFSPQTASKERLAPTGRGMQMLGSGHRSSFTHIEDEDCYITSEILRKPGEPSNTTSNHSTQPKMNWSTPTPTTITVVKTHGALKQKTRRSSRTPRPSTRLRPKPPIITTPHLTQMSDPRTALPDPGSKHQRPISPPTSLHSVDTAQLFYGEEAVTRNYKSSHNQSTMAEPSVQTASTPDPADPAQSAFMAVQTPRPSSSHFPSLQDSGVISHNEELPEIGSVSPSPIRAQVHRTRQETLHPLQGQTIQEMGTKSLVDNTMAKSPPVVKPTLVASPPRKFDIKQSSTTYTDTITLCLLLQRENGAFEFEADPLLIPLEEFQKYTVPEIFSLYARNSDMPLERLHCLTIFATFSNYETLVVREDDGEDKWEMAKKKLKKLVMFERKKDMSITDFEIWMRFSD
ncbi:hypothetical protein B7494_g3113 [Chlorociboria aeruginascens]|nr:hypothetical protein B7494_g3113 [Chlorociboria aeruginascens]